MTTYFIVMYVISLALAYVLTFTKATLAMGRSLSDAGTATGFQDAITPPRFTTATLFVYAACLCGVIYGIWAFGWLVGMGAGIGLFIAAGVNTALVLPKSNSEHFRKIILHSMINRHADYVKSGDALRASVMAELLAKAGIPINEFVAQVKKQGDA
jgi:hypothetical protein